MGLKHGITKGGPNNIPAENRLEILTGAPPFLIPTQHWFQLKTNTQSNNVLDLYIWAFKCLN